MPEVQTAAPVTSPAEVEDPFKGQTPTLAEYNRYREDGTVPERVKPAEKQESAPAKPVELESEGTPPEKPQDSETAEAQEKPHKKLTAKERIAQLNSTIEKLWEAPEPDTIKIAQLEATIERVEERSGKKRKTEAASVAPVKADEPKEPTKQPQSYQEFKQSFDASKWIEQYSKENPTATYEQAVDAMTDYKADVRDQFRVMGEQQSAQAHEFAKMMEEASERYEDFEEIAVPFGDAIMDPAIPDYVKKRIGKSKVLADLVYTLGENADAMGKFITLCKRDPDAAIDQVVLTEAGIKETLKVQKPIAPAKQQTSAPKPAVPVTGASSRAFDASDEGLSPDEWFRKRNEQLARK